jgi:phosphoserine phosphatase RsbU/P
VLLNSEVAHFRLLPFRPWMGVALHVLLGLSVGLTLLYQRVQSQPVYGTDFVEPLRRLLFGPGLLSVISLALLTLEYIATRHLSDGARAAASNTLHVIGLAMYSWFLGGAAYTWRSMLLFRAPETLKRDWRVFEIVQVGLLVILLIWPAGANRALGSALLALLAIFSIYLNVNQRWVAYLSRPQKLQAALLQLGLLVSLVLFGGYFEALTTWAPDPLLLEGPLVQATLIVGVVYLVANGLLLLFNLPATTVFEQRREELLTLQRQSQRIQQGQSAEHVIEQLFTNAMLVTEAEAGWLQLADQPIGNWTHMAGLPLADLVALEPALTALVPAEAIFVCNNTERNAELRPMADRWRSALLVPLPLPTDPDGQVSYLGLLREPAQGFDRGTIGLVQTYATQALLTLQNLRLKDEAVASARYKRELKIASEVQQSLIPRTLPADRILDISVWTEAATEVGGDFYDFRQLTDTRIAIIVGDVSGKGISAAFHVAQMKGIFHSLMQLEHVPEPDRFMVKANAALAYCLEAKSFITASLYVIDYEQRGFAFARAGHCHTLYYNSMTEQVFYFDTPGLGLGIVRDASYARYVRNMYYDFNPGDVMVIYTDGITEARSPDGEEYGEQRLLNQLAAHHYLNSTKLRDAIIQDVQAFAADAPVRDDQTMLVIKFKNEEE